MVALAAGLCGAFTPGWAAEPEVETPAQVQERVRQVCAPFEAGVPAELDLDAAEAEVGRRQPKGEPGHLELACHAWWSAWRRHGPTHWSTLRLQGTLAGSLIWLRRSGEALPIFLATREQMRVHPDRRSYELGMMSSAIAYLYQQRAELQRALAESEGAVELMQADPDPTPKRRDEIWRARYNLSTLLSTARRFDAAQDLLDRLLAEWEADPSARSADYKAVLLHSLAVLAQRREHYETALDYTRREIAWREAHPKTGYRHDLVLARHNLAVVLTTLGRFDEAEAVYRTALADIDVANGEPDLLNHASDVRQSWAFLLLRRGRIPEALEAAQDALRRVQATQQGGTARELRPRGQLAQAHAAAGDLGSAVAQYRQMLRWIDAGGGDPRNRIGPLLGFARVLVELGDYEEARRIVARAREEVAKVPAMRTEQAELLRLSALLRQAAGDAAGLQADLAQAEQVLAPAYAEGSAERIDLKVLACPVDASACAALRQALDRVGRDAAHPELPPELEARAALALGAHARSSGSAEDAAQAGRHARAALNAAVRAGSPALLGLAYGLQADVADDARRVDEAILFGKLALAETQRQRARVVALGSAAESLFVERRAEVYRSLADRLAGQGRIAEALAVLRLAKRAEQADWGQRAAVQGAPGEEALPLSAAEQRLQQLLFAVLSSHHAVADEYARLRRLQATQSLSADEKERLAALAGDSRRQRDQLQAELEQALDRLSAEATALATPAPSSRPAGRTGRADRARGGGGDGSGAGAGDWRELARVRPRESGVVHAYLLPSARGLRAVVVGRERTWVRSRSLPPGALSREVAAWLAAATERRPPPGAADPLAAVGARLYDVVGRLVDEPARQAGAQRIVLWLDGVLRHLPIAALHDGRQHLAQKYVLLHAAPALAELPESRAVTGAAAVARIGRPKAVAPAAPAELRLQAFGMTEAAAGLPSLPGVARELCGIVRGPVAGLASDAKAAALSGCADGGTRGTGAVAGSGAANAQFTEARLRQGLEAAVQAVPQPVQQQLLHIGTHFVLRPGHVERSWLLLGDGQRLGLADVARLDLRGQRLVTLSACETGMPAGDATDGRQIDGLASAVLGAGARQVLASLWRVDDQATARFMQVFYEEGSRAAAQRGSAGTPDLAAALQRTQARLLDRDGSRASDWAAFVLMEAR